jgi:hypothetical protein
LLDQQAPCAKHTSAGGSLHRDLHKTRCIQTVSYHDFEVLVFLSFDSASDAIFHYWQRPLTLFVKGSGEFPGIFSKKM